MLCAREFRAMEEKIIKTQEEKRPGAVKMGIAVDIGTTTLFVALWDLSDGTLKASSSCYNPQRKYGPDVISRLLWAMKNEDGLLKMREAVLEGLNGCIESVCRESKADAEDICRAVAAGNTIMSHFFAGKDPRGMAEAPFEPAYEGPLFMTGAEAGLNICGKAEVRVVPNIAGHIGGDITAGILAAGITDSNETSLFIDIGTNGEIALLSGGRGAACSTAAGPAFEGAGISCGMRAEAGAVSGIRICDGQITFDVIGETEPKGICGSGLIDALAVMAKAGFMDETGRILDGEGAEKAFGGKVYLTQKDVRNLQLAKGAVAAGVRICMDEMGTGPEDIEKLVIGGAFGNCLEPENAINTGLIPNIEREKIVAAGNTSAAGAAMILLGSENGTKAEEIPGLIRHIELAEREDFQKVYLDSMDLKKMSI
ncbi:MAG: DUF4445 domain-containing protein [Firmicutes bacterium]|nr:DUF4445 domain-containing protein [Bacillota bacterium]